MHEPGHYVVSKTYEDCFIFHSLIHIYIFFFILLFPIKKSLVPPLAESSAQRREICFPCKRHLVWSFFLESSMSWEERQRVLLTIFFFWYFDIISPSLTSLNYAKYIYSDINCSSSLSYDLDKNIIIPSMILFARVMN